MDGWRTVVGQWSVTYEHEDGSEIVRSEAPWATAAKPWCLSMGDPPRVWDTYATADEAKAGHAEEMADRAEARRLEKERT